MEGMKGQTFISASIIFSAALVVAFITTGPEIVNEPADNRNFFGQTLEESFQAFNSGLEENLSIDRAERRIYSYDRFVERQSLKKGIDYSSYSLLVLPGEGNASLVNYYNQSRDYSLRIDGTWYNSTVGGKQSFQSDFEPGKVEILVVAPRESNSFNASTPSMLKHSRMEANDETWRKTRIG